MIEITRRAINVKVVVDHVRRPDAGAIVLFLGSVRAEADVVALDYEVYKPMAEKVLAELAARARAKFGVLDVAIVHRVGRVAVGADSVAIACASAHRRESFEACAWMMNEVKHLVPIWKSEAPRTRSAPKSRSRSRST